MDQLYEQWINELKAVQEAQTDRWEKRWAGDAVTMGQMARRQAISGLRRDLEGFQDSKLVLLDTSITFHKRNAKEKTAQARERLKSVQQAAAGQ